jgi:hypothetical protein
MNTETTTRSEAFSRLRFAFKWLLAAAFLASLLFAHGCHRGDEDHELFAMIAAIVSR